MCQTAVVVGFKSQQLTKSPSHENITSLMSLCLSVSQIILKQLVHAATELQNKHIFHRDIKVENILIETGSDVPRVRLIDFGLSCFFEKSSVFHAFYGKMSGSHYCSSIICCSVMFNQSVSSHSFSLLLLCMCTLGTFDHVPPEYYSHCTYSAGPTTVWQMGVVLFDMLHSEGRFETSSFLNNELEIDNELSESKKDALIRKPASRYQTKSLL